MKTDVVQNQLSLMFLLMENSLVLDFVFLLVHNNIIISNINVKTVIRQ